MVEHTELSDALDIEEYWERAREDLRMISRLLSLAMGRRTMSFTEH